MSYEIIDSVEKLELAIEKVRNAQKVFATYTQEQVEPVQEEYNHYNALIC